MIQETTKIGKRGSLIIPAALRKRFGLEEGSVVIAVEREDGVLIQPATVLPIERYSPVRKAEFLLANAINMEDYENAVKVVREMGLDPDTIAHSKPTS